MASFQEVLREVRKVVQEAHPDLLTAFLTELLEAEVFSAEYYQSLFQCTDPDLGVRTDVEDLARKLALPVWQTWDNSKEILYSALGSLEDPQDDFVESEPLTPDPQLLDLVPVSWFEELLFRPDLPEFETPDAYFESLKEECDALDAEAECQVPLKEENEDGKRTKRKLSASLFEELLSRPDLLECDSIDALIESLKDEFETLDAEAECPILVKEENENGKKPKRKRPVERSSRKRRRLNQKKPAPLSAESPPAGSVSHMSDVNMSTPLPQLLHVSLLPCSATPTLQLIQPINGLVRPTYVLVSPQSGGPLYQIVPLSPAVGAVAPVELSRTTQIMSSLSDTASKIQPPSPPTPVSPSKDKTPQDYSPPSTPLRTQEPRPEIPKRVEDYIQKLKSHLKDTYSVMEGGKKMDSHYIDTRLVQRKLVIQTGKNANKCLEKELVVLSDSERRKAMVDRSHVFQNCGPKPKPLITVLGKTGLGKSTLIQRLALDWSTGGLAQFQFVFLLNCKVLDVTKSNYDLKTLLFGLSSAPDCKDSEAAFKYVLANPNKVLIIFDSFDDIGELEGLLQSSATSVTDNSYTVRQLFSGLFQKKILSGCTLLVATRPKDALNHLLRKVDSILEICCFSPKDIQFYVSKCFVEASKQESALRKIQNQQYIFNLCSNPLLCRFTCFLLEQDNPEDDDTLPSTLTDLCQRVLDHHLELRDKVQGSKQDISQLCNMAWDSFKTCSSLLNQDQTEISKQLMDCGLNCEILASHKAQVTYFSSLFMQNFLAAMFLVQSKDINERTLVAQTILNHRKKKVCGEWQDILQRFILGLLYQKATPHYCGALQSFNDAQAKRKTLETQLENLKPGELTPGRLLELFHCVYETSKVRLAKHLVKKLPENLSFCGAQLTPVDVYVVWHLLQHAKGLKRTFSVDLRDTCVPLSGLKELVALSCITSFRAPTLDTIDLWEDLHHNSDEVSLKNALDKFTMDPFKASQLSHLDNLGLLVQIHREKKLPMRESELTLEDGIPAVRHLKKLEYEFGRNEPEAFLKLIEILPALESLQHLDLENNILRDSEAEKLAGVLNSLSSLRILNLSQNRIGDAGMEKLAQSLAAASSLQKLSLYGNEIADSGAENLASVLPAMKSLLNLDVKYNQFTDIGAKKLSMALKNSPSLKSLQMWNNSIPLGVLDHLRIQDNRITAP
ncbi:MHC class II transactivator isoform X2 [Astyanax mexicanus]|uniref:MHC class II transactivator isoform X2 n=1 Tax=Astyanax mexicanus TaxID=7994 RepID=UPI0020CAC5B7|nr:MHC class II transactivator isoform X2 [Astyanax mexicanus]